MEKFIGLDLGTRTLGIAVSDLLGIVHARENFCFQKGNYKKAIEHLLLMVEIENIKNIVIGLPLQIDRQEGERCQSVRRFVGDILNAKKDLKFYFFDESYSTIEARERLRDEGVNEEKIKKIIDMMSAVVILEDFLRNKGYEQN